MSELKRIQRSRARGWHIPEDAVYVGRPTDYGNPWSGPRAVEQFEDYARGRLLREPEWLEPLRGRDLCCWCALSEPCHADTLLRLANGKEVTA